MSSVVRQDIEGTGVEISEYTKQHPTERFRLVVLEGGKVSKPFDQKTWDEVMASIDSFKGKLPILPDDATSTDSLYV